MLERVIGFLDRRGAHWLAALAVVISLPSLRLGFHADDHILALQHAQGEPPWALFRATAEQVARARQTGAMAWWTSPHMTGEFLRPLSSLSHALLLELAPGAAWLMSLINVLVYGACVWLAALVYRRLLPAAAGVATLAALMFAIDDAHAPSVGWISGRNTLLALLGSIATLWFHLRAIERKKWVDTAGSLLALTFALASGEAGTWAFCYLIAAALLLDPRAPLARIAAIAPHLLIGAVWAAIYVSGHYGIHHSSWYFELSSPWTALAHGVLSLPLTITSLLGLSLISLTLFFPVWKAQLALLPVALFLLWLSWPALTSSRVSRFFGLATALAVLPTFLTVPQDRVLIGAGFTAFGWIATALSQSADLPGIRHRTARVVLRACHIWMAGVLFIPMLASQYRFELGTEALRSAARGARIAVMVNSPIELLANYALAKDQLERGEHAKPEALHQLYTGASELFVERVSDRAIEVTASRGWGYVPMERIFCRRDDLPRPGDERRVHGMTVRALETNDAGLPTRVRFTFDIPLESNELRWFVWTDAGFPAAWRPPALGARVRLAPLNRIKALPDRR